MNVSLINPFHRIAGAEKPLLVERFECCFRVAPIPGRDVRAAVTHLDFVTDRYQFEFHRRGGQAQITRLGMRRGDEQAKWARFGHTQTSGHHNAFAIFLFGRGVKAVPDGLRQ